MPATKPSLQLLCPGLFGADVDGAGPLDRTPALDRLLVRANARETQPRDPPETLAGAFGLKTPAGLDLPSAALCLLAEAPELALDGDWFHADPVHLHADRDRLLLFAGPSLELELAEAAALVAAFNAHFAEDGLRLVAPRPGSWYLRVEVGPRLRTSPLHAVTGQALDAFLPTGADARAWNRWQNEAQMLFYQHPVNQERQRLGRPTISGVWTWGGGVLPKVPDAPAMTIADHPLAAGLVRAAGGHLLGLDALTAAPLAWLESGLRPSAEVVIFWDALWWPALTEARDAWCAALADLEALVARLCAELAAGRLGSVTLDDGQRWTFTLTVWGQRRVWRRGGGLRERLGSMGAAARRGRGAAPTA
ncbi:phosphoglycerate mutase [uncultured Thiodictyon sp.]|uniref:phosphoglycerate mutase n=1 Tax=uncultured Thiodictyon sp. TaxID=1846217 RepID=UPI0025DB5230|nr:phosphoglycerate mutase [uncultured Thiodictyon sp.]